MHNSSLPEKFRDLEEFVEDWALRSESARMRKRWASSMEEIKRFYDPMMLNIEEILNYLDAFDLDRLADQEDRLFLLTLSFAEAASAVEIYKQPVVPHGFRSSDRVVPTE